jgi:glycosyltransferase involved in cell wall biosynthesis
MSIVIFGDLFTFPEGNAATNRVYTYAKGFIENGINVYIICFTNDYFDKKEGNINGINYFHPFEPKKRSRYFIVRRWQKLLKYRNTYSLIKRINKGDKITAINCWSNLMDTHLFAKFLSRLCIAKLIVECNEHPLRYYKNSAVRKVKGKIKFFIESRIADGVLCISHYLINFYKSRGISERKLLLVPSTVDPHRFSQPLSKPVQYPYIGYFGGLTFYRDNVDLLIKAFDQFSKPNSNAHLILGGIGTDEERKQIEDLIRELNLQSKVQLLDYLSREDILHYIVNANILVMVRKNNFYTEVSYPSKLTEFLASSKPVISVNVGEIPLYLKDSSDVFLVEPENIEALAQKLDFVWNNYDLAIEVGRKGKQLTETIFNYKYQAERIISFINSN